MATKIQAARLATESGTTVLIVDGHADNVLVRAATGDMVGTRFPPARTGLESRKRWILAGLAGTASTRIDEGAVKALSLGRSLLAAGIVDIKGRFDRGDSVSIIDPTGKALGCGVVNYSSADLGRIKGCKSSQITSVLGYHYGDEVIHRSNLVVL